MKQISGRHCLFEDIIKWHEGYKKREAQKAQIKEEIAWHPSRSWDGYVPEDKKKETEKNCGSSK